MTFAKSHLRRVRALASYAAILLLTTVMPASAATFCANTAALVKAALVLGQVQGQPFTIQIVQGTYLMDADVNTVFSAPTTIEGGYTANCAARQVNPGNTTINVQGHIFYLSQLVATPQAQINVDGLTVSNANGVGFIAGRFGTFSNDEGSLRLSNARFTQITDKVDILVYNGNATLENILIDHLSTPSDGAVLIDAQGGAHVLINHITVDIPSGKFFVFGDSGTDTQFSVYNSIFWRAAGGAPELIGGLHPGSTIALVNDVFSSHFITGGSVVVQNLITNAPGWIDPASGNYRLQTSPLSPAINSGTLFSPGGEPATDIEGKARIIGSAPDRGAYESLVTDQTTFIVTNTLDSGAGSLREAVTLANGSLSPPKLITFNIRNPVNVPICPAVIGLTTILPTIVGRMTIDGSTQPTSTGNTDPTAFNANLCVVIKPASGTLSAGFTVPANSFASLSLRGLAVGGFTQPVRILGGQGSLIAGNQFGGTANGIALPGAGINAITFGSDASGELRIGGTALADRNVIGDAATSGISNQSNANAVFTTCQIVNNLIGLARDGHTQLANAFGINNSGSGGCQIVGNRIAGNTITNLWLNGSDNNVVQQNIIGVTNQNSGFLNNATGILVTGQGNIIGAGGSGGSVTANTVRFMGAGGVVVKGDTSFGNSVNANLVYDNGTSGTAMDIDLLPTGGAIGPTLNDPGDGDEGPNHLQNFPVLKGLTYTAAGSTNRPAIVSGILNTQSGPHRIDVYFSATANSFGKRGHAEVFVTQATINVGNGPTAFSLPIIVPTQAAGAVISATTTDAAGNTSEIGTALSIDTIFTDGTE